MGRRAYGRARERVDHLRQCEADRRERQCGGQQPGKVQGAKLLCLVCFHIAFDEYGASGRGFGFFRSIGCHRLRQRLHVQAHEASGDGQLLSGALGIVYHPDFQLVDGGDCR